MITITIDHKELNDEQMGKGTILFIATLDVLNVDADE